MRRKYFLHQALLSSPNNITNSALRVYANEFVGEYIVRINSCAEDIKLHNNFEEVDEIVYKLEQLEIAAKAATKAIKADYKQRKAKEKAQKLLKKERIKHKNLDNGVENEPSSI